MTARCLVRSLLLAMFVIVSSQALHAAPPIEWTRVFGSTNYENEGRIAVDVFGNVYAVGGTFGSFPGFQNAGNQDCWLVKYSPNGALLWSRQWGGPDNDMCWDVAVDRCGHAYVVETTLDSSTNRNKGFLHKYLCDGRRAWSQEISLLAGNTALSISVTDGFEIFVTGSASRPALPGGNPLTYVRKFNHCGCEEWTQLIGDIAPNTNGVIPWEIATDRCGNSYVTGWVSGSLDGQPSLGGLDAFVVKFDTRGLHQWTRRVGGPETEFGRAITVDDCGNVLVAGEQDSRVLSFEEVSPLITEAAEKRSENSQNRTSPAFIAKFDAHGTLQWKTDPPVRDAIRGIRTRSGNIFVSGFGYAAQLDATGSGVVWQMPLPYFTKGIELDHWRHLFLAGTSSGTLNGQPPIGLRDAFLMKLTP